MPSAALADADLPFILAHEEAHIQRKDPLWKTLALLLLAVHWMNPLCWLAFHLFSGDIEYACDEKAVREKDAAYVADYAQSLLNYSMPRVTKDFISVPFAGRNPTKARVKNLFLCKKQKRLPAIFILALSCVILTVGMLSLPIIGPSDTTDKNGSPALTDLQNRYPHLFHLDARNGLTVYVCLFAPNAYAFTVQSGADRKAEIGELLVSEYVSLSEMKQILSFYGISPEKVTLVPFGHPGSSHLYDTDPRGYEAVKAMLFPE